MKSFYYTVFYLNSSFTLFSVLFMFIETRQINLTDYIHNFRCLKEETTSDEESNYYCHSCSEKFPTALDLAFHSINHNFYKLYKCPFCTYNSPVKGSIKNHVIRHEKNFPFVCPTCQKGFVCNAIFIEHLDSHTGIKRFQCTFCDKRFLFKRYLHDHIKLNHEREDKGYRCDICEKVFSFKNSFRRHLNAVHRIGRQRWRVCEICNKILANAYGLKMHLRLHTGEKPFICEKCGMKYTRNLYLQRHIKLKHWLVMIIKTFLYHRQACLILRLIVRNLCPAFFQLFVVGRHLEKSKMVLYLCRNFSAFVYDGLRLIRTWFYLLQHFVEPISESI